MWIPTRRWRSIVMGPRLDLDGTTSVRLQPLLGHAMACPAVLDDVLSHVDSEHAPAFDRHRSPPQSRGDKRLQSNGHAVLVER